MKLNIYPIKIREEYVIYCENWETILEEMNGHIYLFAEEYLKWKFEDNKLVSMNMDNTFYPPLSIDADSFGNIINEELLL